MYRHRREAMIIPANVQIVGRVEFIPLLTSMVEKSGDPDFRPYTKVLRLYVYPIALELPIIPKIGENPGMSEDVQPLPQHRSLKF